MSYKSILLNLNIDGPIEPITRIGVSLAKRFDARLIGFCAADAPLPVTMAPEGAAIAAEIWEQSRDEIRHRLTSLSGEFDRPGGRGGQGGLAWRDRKPGSRRGPESPYGRHRRHQRFPGRVDGRPYRTVDPGSLVLRAGRPVLVAAQGAMDLPARRIVVSWKDTREARRAVADALPLMAMAEEVTIVAVDRNPDDWIRDSVKDGGELSSRSRYQGAHRDHQDGR
ncbi:universal stress protein [Mesorhizobium atlanticum]